MSYGDHVMILLLSILVYYLARGLGRGTTRFQISFLCSGSEMILVMSKDCFDAIVWILVMACIAFGTNFHGFCGTILANALTFTITILRKLGFTLLLIH